MTASLLVDCLIAGRYLLHSSTVTVWIAEEDELHVAESLPSTGQTRRIPRGPTATCAPIETPPKQTSENRSFPFDGFSISWQLSSMVLRARWEGIHQKVDIAAGRVEILAADPHVSVPSRGPLEAVSKPVKQIPKQIPIQSEPAPASC